MTNEIEHSGVVAVGDTAEAILAASDAQDDRSFGDLYQSGSVAMGDSAETVIASLRTEMDTKFTEGLATISSEQLSVVEAALSARPVQEPVACKARKQGTSGGNDPADCDWPFCGCDEKADAVITAINESGYEIIAKPFAAKVIGLEEELAKLRNVEPVAWVSDYRKSDGTTDFYVMIGKGESAISLHMHKIRGRAKYEAAEINHALTGSPKPEFSDFDLDTLPAAPQPAHGTSATERVPAVNSRGPTLAETDAANAEAGAEAISAILDGTAGQGVEVKPLEWKALNVTDREAAVANSVLGKWEVWQFPGGRTYIMKPGEHQGTVYEDSYDAAKAYLERAYQSRIAPALATPTPKEESK